MRTVNLENEAMGLIKLLRRYAKEGKSYDDVQKMLADPKSGLAQSLYAMLQRARADAKDPKHAAPNVRVSMEDPPKAATGRGGDLGVNLKVNLNK